MRPLIDGDRYYVTMCGKVFAKKRTDLLKGRHLTPYYRTYPEKELKCRINNTGYKVVGLTDKDGRRKVALVHRLIASEFISNPNNLPEVNHKDGDKTNCKADNLEWTTRKGNALHSTRVLGKNRGNSHPFAKLSEIDVLKIKHLLEKGRSQVQIAKHFKVSNHAIFRIQHGYNWSWLTGYERKGLKDARAN